MLSKTIFNRLRNGEAHGLAGQVIKTMESFDTTALGLANAKADTQNAYAQMTEALVQVRASINTPAVQEANQLRSSCYSALKWHALAYAKRSNSTWKEPAEVLLSLFKAYGRAECAGGYTGLTSLLDNFINDIETKAKYSEAVTALGADDWLTELKAEHLAFVDLYDRRVDEMLENQTEVSTSAGREAVWNAISRLEDYLSTMAFYTQKEEYSEILEKCHDYAKRLTATINQRFSKIGEEVVENEEEDSDLLELETSTA